MEMYFLALHLFSKAINAQSKTTNFRFSRKVNRFKNVVNVNLDLKNTVNPKKGKNLKILH